MAVEHMAEPILIKDSVLGIAEVVDIIQRRKDYHFTDKPSIHAKGGQVYLFSSENDPVKKYDWRCDNYRWCNSGVTRLPRKDPVNSRYLYEKPETSPFYKDKEFVNKNDIGGTNFWPIEYFDMALEITYYLQGLECDIVKASLPILGTTMKRVVIPEILRYLIAERFNISPKDAFQIIKKQSL